MKTLLLLLAGLISSATAKAVSVYDILQSVNPQIVFQQDLPGSWKNESYSYGSFTPIQLHLSRVEQVLRSRSVRELTPLQALNRKNLLNHLHRYWMNGRFPQNIHFSFQTPVFIDELNTHCAVGYLMEQSGAEHLARYIQETRNTAYLSSIVCPGLEEWIGKSGFTAGELAWIQPGYPPATVVTPLLGGVNGSVFTYHQSAEGWIYAGGQFTEANGNPALNIAAYAPGFAGYLWTEVNGGVNGPVYALTEFNGLIIAGGAFTEAGAVPASHVARLGNAGWEAMGTGLAGTVKAFATWNGSLYAAGSFSIGNGSNLAKWTGSDWVEANCASNGTVHALHVFKNKLYAGGAFTEVNGAAIIGLAEVTEAGPVAVGTGPGTFVYAIQSLADTLYAGGEVKYLNQPVGLRSWGGTDWKTLPGTESLVFDVDSSGVILSLAEQAGKLIAAGKFDFFPMVGTVGSGIFKWDPLFNQLVPLADPDDHVYVVQESAGQLLIGGKFRMQFSTELNGTAFISDPTHISKKQLNGGIMVGPNPTEDQVVIRTDDPGSTGVLYNSAGQRIACIPLQSVTTLSLPAAGIYYLSVTGKEIHQTIKLVRCWAE